MKKKWVIPGAVYVFIVVIAGIAFTSSAQNSNTSTTTNKNQSTNQQIKTTETQPSPRAPQDFSMNTWELPEGANRTKNPVETSAESVSKGRELYLARDKGNCIFCHGESGSGNEANLAQLRRKPSNLAEKERMTSMSDGEVFWKISKGINGIMPAGERRMSEEERWHLVNYIRTLVKEPAQP